MTLDHDIVRSFIKNFPRADGEYTSVLEISKDIEALRETHAFLIRLSHGDPELRCRIDELMLAWRSDMNRRLMNMMKENGQTCLTFTR